MLTTHNFRMLNPAVSQTPLCQDLTVNIPRTIISSKTVDLRQFIWVDGEPNVSLLEKALSEKLNLDYYNNGFLDRQYVKRTELVDPMLHNLYVYVDTPSFKNYCSISPAPCCGLFHEITQRELECDHPVLSKQQVEVKPERLLEHGSMVAQHNGTLKSFLLPKFDAVEPVLKSKADKNYIILEFEVENFNVATGMVGVGLPSVTVFGLFISNFLQKESILQSDVKFAIGIHSMRSKHRIHGYLKGGINTANSIRKSNIQGYLVIDTNSPEQQNGVLERLHSDFKIAGCKLTHKRILVSDEIPQAYWMHQMDDEINQTLQSCSDIDALDVAFDFALDGRLSIPVAVGFAFFEAPTEKNHMPHLKYSHAWAETLFKSTELIHGSFKSNYLYCRKFHEGVLTWDQQ